MTSSSSEICHAMVPSSRNYGNQVTTKAASNRHRVKANRHRTKANRHRVKANTSKPSFQSNDYKKIHQKYRSKQIKLPGPSKLNSHKKYHH